MKETAKRLVVASGMMSLMLASSVPALAQEGEGAQYGSEPVVAEEEVSATFELAVEGEAPAGAAFFGYLNPGEPFPVALTDSDGDGVYVGSYDHVGAGDSMGAGIVQGTGSRDDVAVGASPGEPTRTIRDFGDVTFDGDKTLSASVSFADGDDDEPAAPAGPATDPVGSATPVAEEAAPVPDVAPTDPAPVTTRLALDVAPADPAPVPVVVEDVDGGAEADAADVEEEVAEEVSGSAGTGGGARVLPSTGGAALTLIGAGALLTAAGLLLRRATG